jgi:hypothetical protein
LDYVRGELFKAGSTMAQAAEKGISLSAPLLRWSELAKCVNNDEQMVGLIGDEVDKALQEARESSQTAAPEALRWIEAAEPFARIFKGPLEVAVTRAGRKLELFHRRAYDARFLENYYLREAQDEDFKELIQGPDDLWALHYVGLGGTGKTMLMRHISSQLAPSPDYNLAVARIDFDHLNPDYPSIRPGLLLTGLAEELRAYADEFTSHSFRSFDRATLTLHEKIRGEASFGSASGVSLNDRIFIEVLDLFIVELNNLWSHGKRPLLILDTCEELAKIRADGKPSDSVKVTFEILEYLHDHAPQLRVVFSGRRPLAWSGHGWIFSTRDVQQSKDVLLEDQREYLRLHEIRGFTKGEALDLLKRFEKNGRMVEPALFDAILDQSNASDQTFDSRFEFTGASATPDTEPRYNPFDLDMYASWSCDDETLDRKKLEKGAHYYVRERIVDRAHYLVKRYLPEIVLLGRFDREMMRELIVSSGGQFDVLFPELIDQEWIDVDRVPALSATVWAMDNVMRTRLKNYYADAEGPNLNSASSRVGNMLYDLTLTRDWKDLTPAYFDAALRALSSNKVKAAEWWSKVEAKLAESVEWPWAMKLTDLLLAEGGPVARADITAGKKPEQESILRAAVMATRAAALTHLKPLEAKSVWEEVLEKAERHPIKEGAQRLKFRAVAGIFASLRHPEYAESTSQVIDHAVSLLRQMPLHSELADAQATASFLAMLEGVTELCERYNDEGELPAQSSVTNLASFARSSLMNLASWIEPSAKLSKDLPSDLQIFCSSLLPRIERATGSESVAVSFDSILKKLDSLDPGSTAQQWLDWHRPDDFRARIKLHYIAAMYPKFRDAESTLQHVGTVALTSTSIDTDRLASAVLDLSSCISLPPLIDKFDEELERSLSLRSVSPSCNVHHRVPPYFVSLLKARADAGFIDEVVRRGVNISKEAEIKGDTRSQQAADRLMSQLAYRFRLRDEPSLTFGSSLGSSNLLADIDIQCILAALDGARSDEKLGVYQDKGLDLKKRRDAVLAHIGWRTGSHIIDFENAEYLSPEGNISFQKLLSSLDSVTSLDESLNLSWPSQNLSDGDAMFRAITAETFSLFLDGVEASHDTSPTRRRLKNSSLLTAWEAWNRAHATEPIQSVALYVRAASLTWGGIRRADSDFSSTELELLTKRIGMRRAAGIALEEGMLLSIRLPQYARIAFELALRWFRACGDNLGSLLSNLSLAMLYAKLQDVTSLRQQLEPARADYRQCEASLPALPRWDPFFGKLVGGGTVTSTEFAQFLDSLAGSCWRPWIVRLTICLIRYREFAAPGELSNAAGEWVEKNYLAVVNLSKQLPAEFDSSFLYGESISLEDHESRQRWFARLKGLLSRFQNLLYGLVGLAFFITGLGLIMRLVRYLLRLITGSELGTGQSLLITLGSLVALAFLPRLFKLYRAMPFRIMEQTISIENDEPISDPNRPLQSTSRIELWLRMPPFFSNRGTDTEILAAAATEQYRTLPEIIPEKFRRQLARNGRWLDKYFGHITLAVEERNAAAPWEAVFGLVQQKGTSIEQNRWLFRRTVKTRTSPNLDAIEEPIRVLSWAPDLSQVDMARTIWRNELQLDRFSYAAEAPTQQIQEGQKEVHLIHLIGTPIEALSGIRLEIGDADPGSSSTYDYADNVNAPVSESAVYERGFLVRADELPLRFSNLRVCIVQGAVLPEEAPRTSSQRFEAAKLRRFGADLAKSGIGCVILLPPTTREISIEALGQIAQLLSKGPSRGRAWMKMVRAIQEIIAARGHSDKDAALEMALDVCVYMVEGFQFHSSQSQSRPNDGSLNPS